MGSKDLWICTACVQKEQLQKRGLQTVFCSLSFLMTSYATFYRPVYAISVSPTSVEIMYILIHVSLLNNVDTILLTLANHYKCSSFVSDTASVLHN